MNCAFSICFCMFRILLSFFIQRSIAALRFRSDCVASLTIAKSALYSVKISCCICCKCAISSYACFFRKALFRSVSACFSAAFSAFSRSRRSFSICATVRAVGIRSGIRCTVRCVLRVLRRLQRRLIQWTTNKMIAMIIIGILCAPLLCPLVDRHSNRFSGGMYAVAALCTIGTVTNCIMFIVFKIFFRDRCIYVRAGERLFAKQ